MNDSEVEIQRPGVLIVLEGPDGCGKTTQANLLHTWFSSEPIRKALQAAGLSGVTRLLEQPQSVTASPVRDLVCNGTVDHWGGMAKMLLFQADRADQVERVIKPTLLKGDCVILTRYTMSTLVYQGAERDVLNGGAGPSDDEIMLANELAAQGLAPDLTVVYEVPVSRVLERLKAAGKNDAVERKGEQFFTSIIERYGREVYNDDHAVSVIGDQSVAAVEAQTRNVVVDFLGSNQEIDLTGGVVS